MLTDELEALLTPSLGPEAEAEKALANPNNAKADLAEEHFLLFAAFGVFVALMAGVLWIGVRRLGIQL